MIDSPFLDTFNWLDENQFAFVWKNNFPVSPGHVLICPKILGHVLICPKRVVLTPFELSDNEILDCMSLLRSQKILISRAYRSYRLEYKLANVSKMEVKV